MAENRERYVVDNGRPYQTAVVAAPLILREAVRKTEPACILKLPTGGVSRCTGVNTGLSQSFRIPLVPFDPTPRRELLDDPFLIDTRSLDMVGPERPHSESQISVVKGFLDLEYEFPINMTVLSQPSAKVTEDIATRTRYVQREELTSSRCATKASEWMPQSTLRDVSFGEEASSGRALQGTKRPISICNKQTTHPDPSAQGLMEVSRYGAFQATARSLFPPPGLTVANPHRGLSRQGFTAMACKNEVSQKPYSGTSNTEVASTKVANTTTLRFSDPDGIRQGQEHEIANGLSQQAPTLQNFKGPCT